MGLAVCLSPIGDLALYAVLVTQLEAVGLTLGAAGLMLGVNRLIRLPGNPLAGFLLDGRRRRGFFLAGMTLGVLSSLGCGLLRGLWPFLLARLAWGVAWTLINVTGMTMVVDVTTGANRGRWMGVYNTWILVGLALGPTVGALLVNTFGFREGMLGCAALTAVGLLVALAGLPETYRPAGGRAPASAGKPLPSGPGLAQTVAFLRAHIPLAAALALFLLLMFAGDGVVLSTVSLLLQQRFGDYVLFGRLAVAVSAAGGLILGMRSLVAAGIGPYAGHLSDRRFTRWAIVACGLVLSIAGFALLAFDAALWAVVLGVALSALGGGAAVAALAALVGDLTPAGREGSVMGAFATAGDLGSAAGPFLAFALVSILDLRWIYLACSLVFLLGLGLVWWGRLRSPTSE